MYYTLCIEHTDPHQFTQTGVDIHSLISESERWVLKRKKEDVLNLGLYMNMYFYN